MVRCCSIYHCFCFRLACVSYSVLPLDPELPRRTSQKQQSDDDDGRYDPWNGCLICDAREIKPADYFLVSHVGLYPLPDCSSENDDYHGGRHHDDHENVRDWPDDDHDVVSLGLLLPCGMSGREIVHEEYGW